jgi:hypothetical protein
MLTEKHNYNYGSCTNTTQIPKDETKNKRSEQCIATTGTRAATRARTTTKIKATKRRNKKQRK